MAEINFNDLKQQQISIRSEIEAAIHRVLNHGQYISGPEVASFEEALEKRFDSINCISCGNGTDALVLALISLDIPSGSHVLLPSFTFAATVEGIINANFVPIFVDIDPKTFNLSIASVVATIEWANRNRVCIGALISVDIFGLPANYIELEKIAREFSIKLVCDAAQSFGASIGEKGVGSFGDVSTTSFFPTKPLGCYGDGGAIFCQSETTANKLRSLKVHGQGSSKYDNIYVGFNSRLDTIQAAILLVKLSLFDNEIRLRNSVANYYRSSMPMSLTPQTVPHGYKSACAQMCLLAIDEAHRVSILNQLSIAKIPAAIYYPVPLHKLKPYRECLKAPSGLDVTESICSRIFAIPMSPYISTNMQDKVIENLMKFS